MTNRSLSSLFHFLTEPIPAIRGSARRRARLLAWLQLSLMALAALSLPIIFFATRGGSSPRNVYAWLVVGVMLGLLAAYGLSRRGHYLISAWLTMAIIIPSPWVSVGLEQSFQGGNAVPLAFIVVPLYLASILLSVPATAALAAGQILILILMPVIYPAARTNNWISLVVFVVMTSVLSVVAAILNRRDLDQLDAQTHELSQSEARLRALSVRDTLTGLFNRRYLEETLTRELDRATRNQSPVGVMLIDIDGFKLVNDTHGHAAGDAMLRELGALLQASARGSDVACRYGGEEFVLLLPQAAREVTRQRAETLRAGAKRLAVNYPDLPNEPITLSIGVAAYPADGATPDALLKSADDALYRAKREGRDRTALAG